MFHLRFDQAVYFCLQVVLVSATVAKERILFEMLDV